MTFKKKGGNNSAYFSKSLRIRQPSSKRDLISIGQKPRIVLYRAKLELDNSGVKHTLDLSKDNKKMYLVITDPRN